MGRNCGWLTAATARAYRERLRAAWSSCPTSISRGRTRTSTRVYVPEMAIDIEAEGERLKRVMDEKDCVNVFVSEGANVGAHRRGDGGARRERSTATPSAT